MAKFKGTFEFRDLPYRVKADHLFEVTAIFPNGQRRPVGTVRETKIRHMNNMVGWVAEAAAGHRGAHSDRTRAAMALMWDGQTYETLIHPL